MVYSHYNSYTPPPPPVLPIPLSLELAGFPLPHISQLSDNRSDTPEHMDQDELPEKNISPVIPENFSSTTENTHTDTIVGGGNPTNQTQTPIYLEDLQLRRLIPGC